MERKSPPRGGNQARVESRVSKKKRNAPCKNTSPLGHNAELPRSGGIIQEKEGKKITSQQKISWKERRSGIRREGVGKKAGNKKKKGERG